VFRLVVGLIITFIVLTLLRGVVGVFAKGLGGLFEPAASGRPEAAKQQLDGELKRDPVCGTFVATTASVKKTIGGEVLHFCSAACRDKYK
jgi:YHS domain-containing protein